MTKQELVVRIAESNDIASNAAASRVMELMIEVITEALVDGQEVNISGLGKLIPVTRTGSTAITGTEVEYNTKGVKFSVSKPLKRAVNS